MTCFSVDCFGVTPKKNDRTYRRRPRIPLDAKSTRGRAIDRASSFFYVCDIFVRLFLLFSANIRVSLSLFLFAIYIANRQCDQNNFGATFWREDGSIKEVLVVPRLLDIRDCEFYRLDLLNPRERERTRENSNL